MKAEILRRWNLGRFWKTLFGVINVGISRSDRTIIEHLGEMELVGSEHRGVIDARCIEGKSLRKEKILLMFKKD